MASSPNTKSTSTTETVRGEHQFDVAGYSRKQGAGAGSPHLRHLRRRRLRLGDPLLPQREGQP